MTDAIFDHDELDVIAHGSALECAAIRDVLIVSGGINAGMGAPPKAQRTRIVAMLTRLVMGSDRVAEVAASQDGVVEYEHDSDLRDTEQIPFLECAACREPGYLPTPEDAEAAIGAFLDREVLPYAPDAWYAPDSMKIGYEISFTRYFYKPKPLRPLEEIRADILAVRKETEGLLEEIIGEGAQ